MIVNKCGAKTRAGTPCQRAPLAGRTRCRLHGGATPRGRESPHYKHGRRSTAVREVGLHLAGSLAEIRRELAQDRHSFNLAILDDIHARLFYLELAVFGEGREWFDLTPHPDDASIAAALNLWDWGEARLNRMQAEPHEDADAARNLMKGGVARVT